MQICPACGAKNRGAARFCIQCASPLAPPPPAPAPHDDEWLVATLSTPVAYHPMAPNVNAPAAALPSSPPAQDMEREHSMDQQPQQPGTPALFGGRYEQVSGDGPAVEVVDREPWRRCWACGVTSNEAGELFCTECGASLEGRRYHGALGGPEPEGLALVPEVHSELARAMLPQIWDEVREGDRRLVLTLGSGRDPIAPPLAELDAINLGLGIARLLVALHAEGLTLGEVELDEVELSPEGQPLLRAAPHLRRGGDPAGDLPALAKLLEASTATPRTTKRLTEEQAEALAEQPGIPAILSGLRTGGYADAAALVSTFEDLLADKTQPAPLWALVGARSDTGMVRDHNEDSLLTLELRTDQNNTGRSWGLYVVADGMGGHSAGEVASGLALRGAAEAVMRGYLTPTLEQDAPYEEERLKAAAFDAITQANEYVIREAQARGNDMGTTITMAVVSGDRAVIGNVGDSRTYIYRDGELRRVSRDHSLVQRLVDLGQIAQDDVYTHPQRNAVLRSLGDRAEVGIDLFVERLRPGDVLLCCSDGLWEMVRDPQIAEIIAANADPQAACEALVAQANANGGEDNISAVLVKFVAYAH